MAWNCAPALFVAADSFEGDPQQAGNLFLGFAQLFPDFDEFFAVHIGFSRVKD